MSSVEAPEYIIKRVDDLEDRVRGSPGIRAIERSVTVLGLGTVIYGGAVLYNVISDLSNRVDEAVDDAVRGVNVSPIVFSDEGRKVLEADQLGKKFGYIRLLEFRLDYDRAQQEYKSTGMVKALPGTAARVKHWEDVIAHKAPQLLSENEKLARVHPFDRAVGSLLNNRSTFWMVIGGLALVPMLPVLGGIIKEAVNDG